MSRHPERLLFIQREMPEAEGRTVGVEGWMDGLGRMMSEMEKEAPENGNHNPEKEWPIPVTGSPVREIG